jgi:hypothetical protein
MSGEVVSAKLSTRDLERLDLWRTYRFRPTLTRSTAIRELVTRGLDAELDGFDPEPVVPLISKAFDMSGYEKEFVMGSTVAHTVDFHDLRASSAFDYFVGSSQRVKPCQQLRIPFPARPPSRSCRHIDLFKGLALCVDIRTCIKIRCIQTFMT